MKITTMYGVYWFEPQNELEREFLEAAEKMDNPFATEIRKARQTVSIELCEPTVINVDVSPTLSPMDFPEVQEELRREINNDKSES